MRQANGCYASIKIDINDQWSYKTYIRVDRLFPQRLRHLPEIAETVPRFRHFFCPDSGTRDKVTGAQTI